MNSISEIQGFLARTYARQDGTPRRLNVIPYGYPLSFTGLAQNTTQSAVINIQANGDFVCLGLRHRASIGAAQTVSTKTAPFVRCLIVDSGSAQQLTSAAVDLENWSQNGDKQVFLPYPRIMAGKSSQTVQVTNWAPTAETYALDLFLSGVLVQAYD